MNLNYKPENKDKDSSEILLEYIKNDYWYKQGHKSKNYILSNEIISEYFKRKIILDFKEKYLNMSNNMISKKLVNSILLLLKKILGIA